MGCVFLEGLWRPEEPTVVAADNCGWPRVSWTLGLHPASSRGRSESYARVCNLASAVGPLTTISTSQPERLFPLLC